MCICRGYRSNVVVECSSSSTTFFILTTEKSISDNWKKRIETMTSHFNAELKHNRVDEIRIGPDGGSVEFTGVHFDWHCRKPREVIDKVDLLEELLAADNEDPRRVWTGTFRKLASVIGQCLWAYRIAGRFLYDCRDYQSVAKAAYPAPYQDWDSETRVSGLTLVHLLQMYKECRNTDFKVAHPNELSPCETIGYLTTDASFKDEIAEIGFAYTIDTSAAPIQQRLPLMKRPDSQIALEELRAVLLALRHMRETLRDQFPDLVILGIDSTHAKGMITNGIARTDEAI
jgi:hypothetical protein